MEVEGFGRKRTARRPSCCGQAVDEQGSNGVQTLFHYVFT